MLSCVLQARSWPAVVPGARSDEAGYAICCVTVWCLCVHRIDLGQVLFLVHGLVEVVTPSCVTVCCLCVLHDRSGPAVVSGAWFDGIGYVMCCVTVCCLCVHRIDLGQVPFLVHGLMELVTLCVV